mmetsp:Transcript_22199/g.50752  ORF Transcript_22199/g.50752 Transcript_22199/m.50752 type:complete len:272 (-) Transcript_22199:108-923(-)
MLGLETVTFFSNTRRLEELGWTGFCLEPFPSNFKQYKRTCKLIQKAVVEKINTSWFFRNCEYGHGNTGWSGFETTMKSYQWSHPSMKDCKRQHVPQITPIALMNNPGIPRHLGYLSLDVEGNELGFVRGFPWKTHCADLWTIEEDGDIGVVSEVRRLMKENGCIRDGARSQGSTDGFYRCNCSRVKPTRAQSWRSSSEGQLLLLGSVALTLSALTSCILLLALLWTCRELHRTGKKQDFIRVAQGPGNDDDSELTSMVPQIIGQREAHQEL